MTNSAAKEYILTSTLFLNAVGIKVESAAKTTNAVVPNLFLTQKNAAARSAAQAKTEIR